MSGWTAEPAPQRRPSAKGRLLAVLVPAVCGVAGVLAVLGFGVLQGWADGLLSWP